MQEQWLSTLDTKEAAAFAALGATIKIISDLHERTSTRTVRFLISPTTADRKWQTGKIRLALKQNTLVRDTPAHPFVTILRAYQNRGSILEMQKQGSKFQLLPVTGSPGIHQYVASDSGLPGVTSTTAAVRTQDLKMAAALVTVGFPLLRITGDGSHHEYTLAAMPAPGTAPGIDAATLLADWRADASAMPFALPFVQAATGLLFHEQLRGEVARAIDTILLSKPRSTSHAAIRADAAPAAWDAVSKFFTGTR